MKIGIIDYGMGNLASVKNSLDFLSISSKVFNEPKEISQFDKLILPGVGAFGKAMENLKTSGFDCAIRESVIEKKVPILGICLGMQLMLSQSEEHGKHEGLNLIAGNVISFRDVVTDIPVPHMGWNDLKVQNSNLLHNESAVPPSFYFVHSFFCHLEEKQYVTGIAEYGIPFHAMFEKEHISGCQFHPEKSQKDGLQIFINFAAKNYA